MLIQQTNSADAVNARMTKLIRAVSAQRQPTQQNTHNKQNKEERRLTTKFSRKIKIYMYINKIRKETK